MPYLLLELQQSLHFLWLLDHVSLLGASEPGTNLGGRGKFERNWHTLHTIFTESSNGLISQSSGKCKIQILLATYNMYV